jgi:signal peptidase II
VLVVIADRSSEIFIENRFGVGYGPRQVIDHLLFLTVIRNTGAAFGLFQNFTVGLLIISTIVVVGIVIYYARVADRDWPALLGLALIVGGAIGNAYDRGVRGSVIDFIQVPDWPIFNVADSAITIGVLLLIVGAFWRRRPAT